MEWMSNISLYLMVINYSQKLQRISNNHFSIFSQRINLKKRKKLILTLRPAVMDMPVHLTVVFFAIHLEIIYSFLKVSPLQWRSGNAQNQKTEGPKFKPRSRLSTQPFGAFCGFLRNQHKYRLESHRKTHTEGAPPIVPGPTS